MFNFDRYLVWFNISTLWLEKNELKQDNQKKKKEENEERTSHGEKSIKPDMAKHLQQFNQFEVNMASVPRFYLIPKVHKTPVVGRPIVASFNWINQASKTLSTRLRLVITQLQLKRDQGLLPVMAVVGTRTWL